MAIGNIDSMSSMLARMTPQQRQQYAMMHHNDPFVVSLAKFVNDVEQQKAQAMQSQRLQAMPPMPPVVQQEIAAMAPQPMPEETGIGALPERSMANMAGGGITGEDDGVERYADTGYVSPLQAIGTQIDQMDQFIDAAKKSGDSTSVSYYQNEKQKLIAQLEQAAKELNLTTKPPVEGPRALREVQRPVAQPTAAQPTAAQPTAVQPTAAQPTAVQPTAAQPTAAASRPSSGVPSAVTPQAPTAADLQTQFENIRKSVTPADPAAAERAGLQTLLESRGPEALAEFEAAAKTRQGRYAGREERLTKQEAELSKEAETNTGLALLAAAGAMLKPGGFAAGAANAIQTALPQFITGRERIKAAQDKIAESRDKLEDLRFASEDMTDKERRALKNSIRQDAIDIKKLSIDSIMERDKVGRDEAKIIFDKQIALKQTQIEQEGLMRRAQMQLGQEPGELRMLRAIQADPKLLDAYQKMQATRGSGLMSLLGKYADPAELQVLKATDPEMYALVVAAQKRAMMPQPMTAPGGAPVRP